MEGLNHSAVKTAQLGYAIFHERIFRHFLRLGARSEHLVSTAKLLDNSIVSEIQTKAGIDQRADDERLMDLFRPGSIIRPIPSAFGTVYPKVDPVA